MFLAIQQARLAEFKTHKLVDGIDCNLFINQIDIALYHWYFL